MAFPLSSIYRRRKSHGNSTEWDGPRG